MRHTPTVVRDKLLHPWQVCSTCGAASSATLTGVCYGPRSREDVYTNTVDDAARYERERTRDAGEDDRPTLADCGDF